MRKLEKLRNSLKDATSATVATATSHFCELEVAIIKATKHNNNRPKEKHLQRIISATFPHKSGERAFLATFLERRLTNTSSWNVALKSLSVFHTIVKHGHHSYVDHQTLISSSHFLHVSHSALVRSYSLYLHFRIDFMRTKLYDLVKVRKHIVGRLEYNDLFKHLAALHKVLRLLLDCVLPLSEEHLNVSLIRYTVEFIMGDCDLVFDSIYEGLCRVPHFFFELGFSDAAIAIRVFKKGLQQMNRFLFAQQIVRDPKQCKFLPFCTSSLNSIVGEMEEFVLNAMTRVKVVVPPNTLEVRREDDNDNTTVDEVMKCESAHFDNEIEEANARALGIQTLVCRESSLHASDDEFEEGGDWALALLDMPSNSDGNSCNKECTMSQDVAYTTIDYATNPFLDPNYLNLAHGDLGQEPIAQQDYDSQTLELNETSYDLRRLLEGKNRSETYI